MIEEITQERLLYVPARRFLHVAFVQKLQEQTAAGDLDIYVADTSTTPSSEGGQWTRPDIAALALGHGRFVPYWRAELHTFEVKTAGGLSEAAVHEANAQARFGHFAWLMFQSLGRATAGTEGLFQRVRKLASHLGIGVIHFVDPDRPQDWVIEVWPRRSGTDDQTADMFVRERFPAETKEQIATRLSSLGWAGDH